MVPRKPVVDRRHRQLVERRPRPLDALQLLPKVLVRRQPPLDAHTPPQRARRPNRRRSPRAAHHVVQVSTTYLHIQNSDVNRQGRQEHEADCSVLTSLLFFVLLFRRVRRAVVVNPIPNESHPPSRPVCKYGSKMSRRFARPASAALHRRGAHLHDFGDFLVAQVFEFVQQHRFALPIVQRRQRPASPRRAARRCRAAAPA